MLLFSNINCVIETTQKTHLLLIRLEMEIVLRHPQIVLNENSIGTKLTIICVYIRIWKKHLHLPEILGDAVWRNLE